ncbi:MAG: hypothetical protein ACRETL_09245 [Gammaproteobacteria bacterium]
MSLLLLLGIILGAILLLLLAGSFAAGWQVVLMRAFLARWIVLLAWIHGGCSVGVVVVCDDFHPAANLANAVA